MMTSTLTPQNPTPEAVFAAWLTIACAYGGYARVAVLSRDGDLAKGLTRLAVRAAATYIDGACKPIR